MLRDYMLQESVRTARKSKTQPTATVFDQISLTPIPFAKATAPPRRKWFQLRSSSFIEVFSAIALPNRTPPDPEKLLWLKSSCSNLCVLCKNTRLRFAH